MLVLETLLFSDSDSNRFWGGSERSCSLVLVSKLLLGLLCYVDELMILPRDHVLRGHLNSTSSKSWPGLSSSLPLPRSRETRISFSHAANGQTSGPCSPYFHSKCHKDVNHILLATRPKIVIATQNPPDCPEDSPYINPAPNREHVDIFDENCAQPHLKRSIRGPVLLLKPSSSRHRQQDHARPHAGNSTRAAYSRCGILQQSVSLCPKRSTVTRA